MRRKVKGRKVTSASTGNSDIRPWHERGRRFLKVEAGKLYKVRIVGVPRDRMAQFGKQDPRPVTDIATDQGTLSTGHSTVLGALSEFATGKDGVVRPEKLIGRTLTFKATGKGTGREYPVCVVK